MKNKSLKVASLTSYIDTSCHYENHYESIVRTVIYLLAFFVYKGFGWMYVHHMHTAKIIRGCWILGTGVTDGDACESPCRWLVTSNWIEESKESGTNDCPVTLGDLGRKRSLLWLIPAGGNWNWARWCSSNQTLSLPHLPSDKFPSMKLTIASFFIFNYF